MVDFCQAEIGTEASKNVARLAWSMIRRSAFEFGEPVAGDDDDAKDNFDATPKIILQSPMLMAGRLV